LVAQSRSSPDGSTATGEAAAQAARCCAIIVAAIVELGGTAADVVRTRMLLTDPSDQDAVGAARPAARSLRRLTVSSTGLLFWFTRADARLGGSERAMICHDEVTPPDRIGTSIPLNPVNQCGQCRR
jgi:hypothetical protein